MDKTISPLTEAAYVWGAAVIVVVVASFVHYRISASLLEEFRTRIMKQKLSKHDVKPSSIK